MRLPRDISGDDLIKALRKLGYEPARQKGSHVRLTTTQRGQHHVTVPRHSPLRLGTLRGILDDTARHFNMPLDELVARLFNGS